MKPLILVHNFSEEDFSLSKFNNFFNSVSEKAKITDRNQILHIIQ